VTEGFADSGCPSVRLLLCRPTGFYCECAITVLMKWSQH